MTITGNRTRVARMKAQWFTYHATGTTGFLVLNSLNQFVRIHTNSLINIEKTLNRPIPKFYNGDDVNAIAAELRLTKTRTPSFYSKHLIFYNKLLYFI